MAERRKQGEKEREWRFCHGGSADDSHASHDHGNAAVFHRVQKLCPGRAECRENAGKAGCGDGSAGFREKDHEGRAIGDEKPEAIEMTVSSFWNADGSGLVLHAECSVGDQEESASMILKRERLSVYTPSNAGREEETEDEP